ncbi:MAG: Hpt domain-containing protein, partial [Deltaproteobacteria bacterium]
MMSSENRVQKITVYIDADLISLIPEFLENRQKDIIVLKKALEQNDYPAIQAIGHNLKGSGGSYGLDTITEIGKSLEQASENKSVTEVGELIGRLSSYLENIEVLETKRNMACAFCGRPFQPRADEKYCPQ